MLIRIIRTLYPHWGAYSGINQFVRYLDQGKYTIDMQVVSDSDDDFPVQSKALGDVLRCLVQEHGMQWYKLSDLMVEMRTLLQCWPRREPLKPHAGSDAGYWERMQLAMLISRMILFKPHAGGDAGYWERMQLAILISRMILHDVEVPKKNIDVIHYLDGEHSAQFIPKLYSGRDKSRPRIIATYHQHPEVLRSLVSKEVIANLDCVTLVSPEQLAFFEDLLPRDRIRVILHGIDTTYFRPANDAKDHRIFRCITVGHYQRDYNVLREVAQKLNQHENIEFHIVTSKSTGVEDLLNVRIYRDIDDAILLSLYQQADVLFLPLLQSTANNALLEGMACGLPVLSSDLLSVKSYVYSKDAILIKDNKPEQFADAILHLVHHKYERQAMAIAARKRAEELDWRNVVMQYEDLYSTVAIA